MFRHLLGLWLISLLPLTEGRTNRKTVIAEGTIDLENFFLTEIYGDLKRYRTIFDRLAKITTFSTIPNASEQNVLRETISSLYSFYGNTIITASIPTDEDVVLLPIVNTITNTYSLSASENQSGKTRNLSSGLLSILVILTFLFILFV